MLTGRFHFRIGHGEIAKRHKNPSEAVIRHELEGNLCRCTGYHNIVKAIAAGAKAMAG